MIAQVCAMYGYPLQYVTSEIQIWDFYTLHMYGSEMKQIDAASYALENRIEMFGYPKQQKSTDKKKSQTIKDALTADSVTMRKCKKEDLKFV